ncbi:transposase [Sinorhizobium sp. BJ1]|uniref:transposase n=1 Tax=Sinorhizobium sp. BJ1 TaxID=2035455 RepID=UPI000BE7916D|nr:transposase [Sinorhizobium sp. BJ1]PDT81083.1 hypothetical protein CO676_24500 [Sinorhizobium sp. BJ1]
MQRSSFVAILQQGSKRIKNSAVYGGDAAGQVVCSATGIVNTSAFASSRVRSRLFLPESLTSDQDWMTKAGVSEPKRIPRTKPEIALEEIDRLIAAGSWCAVCVECLLMRATRAQTDLGCRHSKQQKAYPHDVALIFSVAGHGRPRKHPIPDTLSTAAESLDIEELSWRRAPPAA